MEACITIRNVVEYLLIGMAYASVKHYALWEYYGTRTFMAKFIHYWFEACFWPLDFVVNTIKLFINNKSN